MKSKKVCVLVQYPSLAVGVTQIGLRDWDFETWKFTKTWTMHTINGATNTDESEEPGLCTEWISSFGDGHTMVDGYTLSLTLCDDRSVSITLKGTEVRGVFTDIPQGPMWAWIYLRVYKLEIVQPDKLQWIPRYISME